MDAQTVTEEVRKTETSVRLAITLAPDLDGNYHEVLTLHAGEFKVAALCTFKDNKRLADLHVAPECPLSWVFPDKCGYVSGNGPCEGVTAVNLPENLTDQELMNWMVALLFEKADVINNLAGNIIIGMSED